MERVEPSLVTRRRVLQRAGMTLIATGVGAFVGWNKLEDKRLDEIDKEAASKVGPPDSLDEAVVTVRNFEDKAEELARGGRVSGIPNIVNGETLRESYSLVDEKRNAQDTARPIMATGFTVFLTGALMWAHATISYSPRTDKRNQKKL